MSTAEWNSFMPQMSASEKSPELTSCTRIAEWRKHRPDSGSEMAMRQRRPLGVRAEQCGKASVGFSRRTVSLFIRLPFGVSEAFQFGKQRGTPRQFCEECENKRLRGYGTWKKIRNFVAGDGKAEARREEIGINTKGTEKRRTEFTETFGESRRRSVRARLGRWSQILS